MPMFTHPVTGLAHPSACAAAIGAGASLPHRDAVRAVLALVADDYTPGGTFHTALMEIADNYARLDQADLARGSTRAYLTAMADDADAVTAAAYRDALRVLDLEQVTQ